MAKSSAGRSALSRIMQILAAFDVDAVFLTVSQLSVRSGLALATTHRLVAEMEQFGLLERQPDKTYRLGVRLWEIACRTPGALGLREIAKPYLQEVQARVRQHTQLGILEGHEVLFSGAPVHQGRRGERDLGGRPTAVACLQQWLGVAGLCRCRISRRGPCQ